MSRPLTIPSAELFANEFSDGEIRLNCAKKTAHSAVYSAKMGPLVQIPLGPPSSPSVLVLTGESPEKRACARVCVRTRGQRKLQIRASPLNPAKVIRSPFWWIHPGASRKKAGLPERRPTQQAARATRDAAAGIGRAALTDLTLQTLEK